MRSCINQYVYIHMSIYMYIYIYIYMHTQTLSSVDWIWKTFPKVTLIVHGCAICQNCMLSGEFNTLFSFRRL